MASPKKKWLRRRLQELQELEAQQVEPVVEEPVVEEPVEKVAQKAARRVRKK